MITLTVKIEFYLVLRIKYEAISEHKKPNNNPANRFKIIMLRIAYSIPISTSSSSYLDISLNKRKSRIPVASLSSPSSSSSVINLCGAPISSRSSITSIGSVIETKTPRHKASDQSKNTT